MKENAQASGSASPLMGKMQMMDKKKLFMIAGAIIILVGRGVGYMVASKRVGQPAAPGDVTKTVSVSTTEAGAKDASAFKDTATGVLKEGGIKGEGTHHLERPGGASQTVYLTSTVIDMAPFIGKKVQVWGESQAGKHTGWFMDVGKIKVVE